MRKNALITCCFVCALGAFGAFFRWLQNQLSYNVETKINDPSMWNVMVPLILIAAAVIFYLLIRRLLGELTDPADMYAAFRGTTFFHPVAAWIVGGISIIGGIVTLFATSADAQSGILTLISLLTILTGITFPSICTASKNHLSPAVVSIFSVFPIVLFTLWLIACYMRNSSVPNVWTYGIEIVTVSLIIIAFYYNAGFGFGKPKPRTALYTSMLAAFMCLVSLADSRYFGMQLILCGTAGMLLMYCWMIVSNMREPEKDAVSAEPAAQEPAPEPEPEQKPEEEPLIPAGEKNVTAEPTLQAPDRKGSDSNVDAIINEFKNQ